MQEYNTIRNYIIPRREASRARRPSPVYAGLWWVLATSDLVMVRAAVIGGIAAVCLVNGINAFVAPVLMIFYILVVTSISLVLSITLVICM